MLTHLRIKHMSCFYCTLFFSHGRPAEAKGGGVASALLLLVVYPRFRTVYRKCMGIDSAETKIQAVTGFQS